MATDATRRYRDVIAYGLVAVAAVYFVGALAALFRSGNGVGSLGFADKAAFSSGLFYALVPVLSLVVAALLVTRLGEVGPSARIVVLVALAIAGLDLLFAVITYLAQFGSDFGLGPEAPADKFVRGTLGLAHLLFLGLACFYLYTALRSLPATAGAAQRPWGAGTGQPSYGQGGQPAWSYGWGQGDPGQPPAWGQPGAAPLAQAPPQPGGWTGPSAWAGPNAGWHDPAAAQQGQPASAWGQAGQEWGQPRSPAAPQWDQGGQTSWAQPSGASEWAPGRADATTGDQAGGLADEAAEQPPPPEQYDDTREVTSGAEEPAPSPEAAPDEPPAEPGGWWRRPET